MTSDSLQGKRWRLRHCATLTPKPSYPIDDSEIVSFLPMEAIGENGTLSLDQEVSVAEAKSGYTYFEDGDIVIAKITPCFENGKGALVRNLTGGKGFGTTELHVLRPGPNLDARYLWWITVSPAFRDQGAATMLGAGGQKRVTPEFVLDFQIALPTLKLQHQIADFLDRETAKIDSLMDEKERLLRLLSDRRQALITEAITHGLNPAVPMKPSGIPWLGEIPIHWDVPTVGIRYEVQLGKMLDEKRISGNFLAPYLRNIDVQWEHINTEDLPQMDFGDNDRHRFLLRTGDILVCEGGEVGRAAIWRGEIDGCYYQKALHRLRQRSENDFPPFLVHFLRVATLTGGLSADANASTIQHLPAEKLRRLRFPAPPIFEQRAIVEWIDAERDRIRSLELPVEASIKTLIEKRAALIHEAVTGQFGN